MLRRLLAPRWLALHALAVLAVVLLARFGFWQWYRAQDTGRVQNYAYAAEWWLFAAFAVFLWVKTMVDALEGRFEPDDEPPPPPLPVAPAVDDDDDPELAAYNRHLAELHARSQDQQ